MKIQDLHPSTQPSVKAKEIGIKNLSDIELLALIIRSGTQKNSALDIAHTLLQRCGGVQSFCALKESQLLEIDGISTVKSQQLLAIIELTTRINKPFKDETINLNSTRKVLEWLNLEIGYQDQESLLAIYLCHQNKLKKWAILFTGSLNQSAVYPREIIKTALVNDASRVILVHNHPSGNVIPSKADIVMTRLVRQALEVCELELVDHLIVGKGNSFSIRQANRHLFEE